MNRKDRRRLAKEFKVEMPRPEGADAALEAIDDKAFGAYVLRDLLQDMKRPRR